MYLFIHLLIHCCCCFFWVFFTFWFLSIEGAETAIFQETLQTTMRADDLVVDVTRSLATMIFIMRKCDVLAFHENQSQYFRNSEE